MSIMDLGIKPVEKIIVKRLGAKFKQFFLDEKCKHIGIFGQSGYGKTVDIKTIAEFHLENDPECIIISIDEKNEFLPFVENTREDLQEYLDLWSRQPKGYKTYVLIPYVGSDELPKELPNIGWHNEGEGCYVDYVVIEESKLDYIDRLAMISGAKGKPPRSVAEWIYEAELYLKKREITVNRENLLDVLMSASNLSYSVKRAIKHAIIDMGTDGVIGSKRVLNIEQIIQFCINNDIRWINVCQYYFPQRLSMPRVVFVKHLIQQLYQLKRHKTLTMKVILCVPEVHTYISSVGYRDRFIARDIFTDVLTKGRALGVKLIADSQSAQFIPKNLKMHFDTEDLHNLGSFNEFLKFAFESLGLRSTEEIEKSEKLFCYNMLTDDIHFPSSRYGFMHLIHLYRDMEIGEFVLKDYNGKLWYFEGFTFPMCSQYHEDKDYIPFKDNMVQKQVIVDMFKEKEIAIDKYELLKVEGEE